MADRGVEPVGSMGTDTALAVLSDRSRLLYDYFKQLFAQVTNPPLDAIREELVTDMGSTLGSERNLLHPEPASCHHVRIDDPVIDNDQLAALRAMSDPAFRSVTLPMLFSPADGAAGLERAMDELCRQASAAVAGGCSLIMLSDRGIDQDHAAVPSLLATAGVHHHLVREGTRTRCSLVIESGEAREVHHMALLLGYGAGAINPYLAFETLQDMVHEGQLDAADHDAAVRAYIKACTKGVLKVMSKMGISTLQSYRGAQIFEAVGFDKAFVDSYFTWTASRIGGIGIDTVADEVVRRHRQGYPKRGPSDSQLETGGEYQWRRDGEYHLFNPETVFKLQHASRSGQYGIYREYAQLVNDQSRKRATLRGLFTLRPAAEPLPLEEVEPVDSILKRFATGAMSYGSISREAHETLAIAMNRLGGKSNTGEGGEDPARYTPDPNGDQRRSAIKQVASGRFGVTSEYLVSADDIQIKMAQGAKPGEGGQLPGFKVYPWIAKVRYSTPGVGLISPPPHHDIYSIEDLAQLIHDLKNANRHARIHVKLVAEVGVGTVAAGVSKAHSDVVLISGHDGGTGASAQTSIKHAGVPWELGLAETQQVLVLNDLRDRIAVQVDGQMKTGRDVVIAALLGAEEYGFSTAPLVVSGCIMMRVCHLDTCPGRRGDAESGVAEALQRQAGIRRELLPVRRRRGARADGGDGLPDGGRDDRPLGPPRRRGGGHALEGEGPRPVLDPAPAGCAADGRPALRPRAGPRPRRGARQRADPPGAAGDRAGHAGRVRVADPQHQPHGRHHAGRRADAPLGQRRPAGRHDPDSVHGYGRPELRRLRSARHLHDHRGGRERLPRQGAVGRAAGDISAAAVAVRAREEHHHRQRRAVRRDRRRVVRPRRRRRAVLRAQQRARTQWSRGSATTAAST